MTQAARTEFIAAGLPEDEFFADAFVTRAEVASADRSRSRRPLHRLSDH